MIVVAPPSELLTPCQVFPVVDVEISSLVDASILNYGALKACNLQIKSINEYVDSQQKIWEKAK